MKDWEQFENQSCKFLKTKLFSDEFKIDCQGGSDSTANDIKITYKDKHIFYIESKLCPSQSGQFVVKIFKNKFTISEKNSYLNPFSIEILKYLNDLSYINTDEINIIDIDVNLSFKWIKHHYQQKGVEYIITSTELDSFYQIVPLNNIHLFFLPSCILRRKKSGTSDIPIRDRLINEEKIIDNLKKLNISILEIKYLDKKMIIKTDKKINKQDLTIDSIFLSKLSDNEYRVKKRSLTNNMNIIFSLKYIGEKKNGDLNDFIKNVRDTYLIE